MEEKILGDRLHDLEQSHLALFEEIELLKSGIIQNQRTIQRRLTLITLAIAALLLAYLPWLDVSIKNAVVTAILGWIGILITKGEIKG